MVHFTADIRILAPVDPARGNHRLLFDVPNRGNRLALGTFNGVPRPINPAGPTDAGNGFLMRQGYTVVWCGWQHDVPEADGLMRIKVPEAHIDGRPVSGRLLVGFQPSKPSRVQLLSDRGHRPYPSNDLDDPNAVLLVRDGEEAPPRTIPRHDWSFARLEAGRVVADPNHVYLAAGFEPGRIYEVIYTTTGAPVIGLGLLAVRDIVSFLRHGSAADNPCAGDIQHAYAFGASQSGRFLRQLLYLGLNEDEAERMVFDGVLVHIAGGKRGGDFNMRFGQPSASLPSDPFPFNEMAVTDPVSGRRDGLLERLAARRRVPKIFFTNTSCEYWRGDASLIHTDATGTHDVEPTASSRFYHFAGTQHSAGTLPLTDTNPQNGERGQQALNSVDYNPLLRALLVRMDRWVSQGEAPPASRYPRLADGSAVAPETVKAVVTTIPGVRFPAHPPRVTRLDFGPEAANGIATTLPPREGEAYPHFVPSVDPRRQRAERHSSARCDRAAGDLYRVEPAPSPDRRARAADEPDRVDDPVPGDRGRTHCERRPAPVDRGTLPGKAALPRPGTPRGAVPDRRGLPVAGRPGAHSRAVGPPLGSARVGSGIRRREIAAVQLFEIQPCFRLALSCSS